MKKKYNTVGTVPNRKIVERGKFDAANTQIYDHSLSLIVTDTTIKSEGVKLFLWVEISPLREMSQRVSQNFHERTECISYQGELLVVVCDPLLQYTMFETKILLKLIC
jgi:hypothetical protein